MTELVRAENQIVDTKQFHLSTRGDAGDVLNGDYKSQIRFNIPDAIVIDDSIDYIHFSVPYVVVPNSFYIINETNCHLYVLHSGVTTAYMFPMGNYTSQSFMIQFRALLPVAFSISLGLNSNQFTITHTTTTFSFTSASTIDQVMGFSGNTAATGLTLTCPRVCNFLPLPRIVMRCPDLAHSFISATTDGNDVILSVPNTAKLNGQIVYNNSSNMKTLFKLEKLNNFVVSLTNDDGVPINFNGISSFFTFQFDIYRRSLAKPLPFKTLVSLINQNSAVETENN